MEDHGPHSGFIHLTICVNTTTQQINFYPDDGTFDELARLAGAVLCVARLVNEDNKLACCMIGVHENCGGHADERIIKAD